MVAGRPARRVKGENPLLAIRDKDIEAAKKIIQERYGFTPPDTYIVDLIKFVNEMAENVPRS
jgi:hypothetical protein